MKPLIVTADDYGMSAVIDEGILALIQAGRVSATSCMTLSPRWSQAARRLDTAVQASAHLGVHLDLTEFAQPRQPLRSVIVKAYLHRLDGEALKATVADQLDRFEQALGRAPDYVDGHQHVHQLPQVREALVAELVRRYPAGQRPWVRISDAAQGQGWKGGLIAALGSAALRQQARTAGLQTTDSLLGVYGFDGDATQFLQRVQGWLPHARGVTALMCHPAAQWDRSEVIGAARHAEFEALSSQAFAVLLHEQGWRIERGPAGWGAEQERTA